MTDIISPTPYRVLARKYRPTDFSGLIGQDALVRTLTNAIQSGRLAHAFVLTGVRGVGKTTTARIIARALNCIGPDGKSGPTIAPCGICEHCRAIAEDRHVDVMEMDAASRTGVNDIREVIEGVRYRPTSARFKVYIIDEVHMLSTAAFNALLKTLEEPPEHVKFIFATTELRKIPVTVLSRCQRFDLRRVDIATLTDHFQRIAGKEGADIDPAALALIARAADGSVRDGLSLLDQAIAHGGGTVNEEQIRDMLGLADRARIFDLFDALMKGDIRAALDQMAGQYAHGADPVVILQDLLELTHWLTRLKVVPDQLDGPAVAETERVRGREMSQALSMPVLSRAWNILLKGLSEARMAPSPLQAAEMTLVRLAFSADLPSPAELVAQMKNGGAAAGRAPVPSSGGMGGRAPVSAAVAPVPGMAQPSGQPVSGAVPRAALAPQAAPAVNPLEIADFQQVVALFQEKREAVLCSHLRGDVHLVRCEPGRLELRTKASAPRDLASRLSQLLTEWTGQRWVVTISNQQGAPTLREQEEEATRRRLHDAAEHPLVQAVLAAFPGATIEKVCDLAPDEPEAADDQTAFAESETVSGEDD